jgi:hypothetical protein
MRTILLSLALVALVALPAYAATEAEQCNTVSKEIDKAFGKRFDKQASSVRSKQAQAKKLQAQGKHGDALKVYEAAAKEGGLHVMPAK